MTSYNTRQYQERRCEDMPVYTFIEIYSDFFFKTNEKYYFISYQDS